MGLTVAVQMDPIQNIRIAGDTTFALLLEAQRRGHDLIYYTPDRLSMQGRRVTARVERLTVQDVEGAHFTLTPPERIDLAEADVVLMRQDPPFDMAYITATHILEMIHPKTLVVNDPASVRNAPEKLFVLDFPALMPPTLITRDKAEIEAFRAEGRVGIWTIDRSGREAKVGAIGVRVKRWVTMHGFSVNVAPDLSHFGGIVPCGLPTFPVTSLEALGASTDMETFDAALAFRFPRFLETLSGARENES